MLFKRKSIKGKNFLCECARSKVKWIDEGDKPSKYFLTQKSRNYIKTKYQIVYTI